LEPSEAQADARRCGGEHRVDAVALAALEVISAHAVIGLEVADDGSTAALRFISRRMVLVTRRTWPEIQTLKRSG